jgi:hypothetical protein
LRACGLASTHHVPGWERCFYCDRLLIHGRLERDHFPIPARHGGTETVPSCVECHSLKDRTTPVGVTRDGAIDQQAMTAILAGSRTASAAVAFRDGETVPLATYALWQRTQAWADPADVTWPAVDLLVDELDALAELVTSTVPQCTTPEARINLAWFFTAYLDVVDWALTASNPRRAA